MSAKMSETDKNHAMNVKLEAGPDFKVPGPRGCTDVLFLLLILATWVILTCLGIVVTGGVETTVLEPGNPERLLAPIDARGRLCGVDPALKGRPLAYNLPSASYVCINHCPIMTNTSTFYCVNDDAHFKKVLSGQAVSKAIHSNTCMFQIKTRKVLNYCIPADINYQAAFQTAYGQKFNGTMGGNPKSSTAANVADIIVARYPILVCGLLAAAVLGFVYVLLLQIPGLLGLLVWVMLISIFVCFAGIGFFTLATVKGWKAENPRIHSRTQCLAASVFGDLAYVCAGLWLCLLCYMCKQIALAVAVIREAARAIGNMKALALYPLLQCFGLCLFLIPWTGYSVYLLSSGNYHLVSSTYDGFPITYKVFTYNNNQVYAIIFFLFTYFWTSEFITALGQIVIAMAVATWYFTRDKSKTGTSIVCQSICKSSFYHAGTAAFGSLIIAVIKTVRTIVAYLQRQAVGTQNKVLQVMLCCLQCCLWCFEKCMKFLNKNAYIQTAIFGTSFCFSCKRAFFLILRNILRIGSVSLIGEFVVLLGKILIPVLCTLAAYITIIYTMADSMHGVIAPLVVTFLLAYCVANLFNEVYGMAISTIMQCYVADEELFPPDERYADGALKDTIHHVNTTASAQEKKAVAPEDPKAAQEKPKTSLKSSKEAPGGPKNAPAPS